MKNASVVLARRLTALNTTQRSGHTFRYNSYSVLQGNPWHVLKLQHLATLGSIPPHTANTSSWPSKCISSHHHHHPKLHTDSREPSHGLCLELSDAAGPLWLNRKWDLSHVTLSLPTTLVHHNTPPLSNCSLHNARRWHYQQSTPGPGGGTRKFTERSLISETAYSIESLL